MIRSWTRVMSAEICKDDQISDYFEINRCCCWTGYGGVRMMGIKNGFSRFLAWATRRMQLPFLEIGKTMGGLDWEGGT